MPDNTIPMSLLSIRRMAESIEILVVAKQGINNPARTRHSESVVHPNESI
jgi:hypothetical protein